MKRLLMGMIDAWFAADDAIDPDDRNAAGGVGVPFFGSVDLFRNSVSASDSGLNLRIASGGITELSSGAFRPLRGLDEGIARLS